MNSRVYTAASLLGLLLVPATALAGDGFPGQYELEGRFLRRKTEIQLKVTKPGRFKVERRAAYTSSAYRGLPPLAWSSTDVTIVSDRMMVVTYEPDGSASTEGLAGVLGNLDPDSASREDVADAISKRSLIRAVYILSANKKKIREIMVNSVRLSWGDWRTAKARGKRLTVTTSTVTPAQARRIARKTILDEWTEEYELRYEGLIAAVNSLAEKDDLRAELAEILSGKGFVEDDYFIEDIHYNRYDDDPEPYLDDNGDEIPFSAIATEGLSWSDGQGLGFYFAYDKRTGEIIDRTETTD